MSLFSEKNICTNLLLKSIKIIKDSKCSNASTWKSSYTANFIITILKKFLFFVLKEHQTDIQHKQNQKRSNSPAC